QDDTLYLVQEFVDGPTLRQAKKAQGCFNEAQIWQLLLDLLPVLDFIHQRRVIHRDIKPDNIIYSHQSEQHVLIDFGVAKLVSGTNWMQTGTVIGSPEYMAPEQTRGKTVPATDLYSLGVTCLSMMTTVSPIDMFDIIDNRWAWRDFIGGTQGVSDRLGTILDKLLESALSQRYQSAQEVMEAIASHRYSSPHSSPPTAAQPLPSLPSPSARPSSPTALSAPVPTPPPEAATVALTTPQSIPLAPAFPTHVGEATPTPPTLPSPKAVPPAPPIPTNLGQPDGNTEVEAEPAPASPALAPVPLPLSTPIPQPESPQLLQQVFKHFNLPQRSTPIVSQQGVDYTPLHNLLGRSQWLKADQYTQELMCQAVGKSRRSHLHKGDIQRLPCDDLAILDQLWRSASRGRFGFMVQLQLYLALEADYGTFCQKVGWPVHQSPSKYLRPTLKAPPGHFPSRDWAGGSNWWHHLEWLQQRWQACHPNS
ncbi:MAG: GUN4 domain-containing protein, partial [Leptolyngbyaceae bacterium]|nr:GUN4 domain-containing protein [Leptolyngbyaceae bacterium]